MLDKAMQNPLLKNDPRVLLVKASVLRQKKDFKASLKEVQAALAIHKKYPLLWAYKSFGVEHMLLSDIYYQEALCYIELNDQETALKALDDAISVEIDPETLYQRALVLEYLGEFRDAEADFKLAIEKTIDPVKKEVALHNRADYFLRQNKNDLATIDFKAALSQNECADALFQLGRLALSNELYDQASDYFNKSIEKEETVKALRLRALTHSKKEEWHEAKSDLDKALKLEPDNKLVQTERENVIKVLKLL